MPIRWSATAISEALDKAEELINQIIEPLSQARTEIEKAKQIPNLPQYIDQKVSSLLFEIDRSLGGTKFQSKGHLFMTIDSIRKDIPEAALESETKSAAHGIQQSLV